MADERNKIADELIAGTRATMKLHNRDATGRASNSLKFRISGTGIQITGVDYFEQIDKGVPPGTIVKYSSILEWVHAKFKLSGAVAVFAAIQIRRSIYRNGAPKDLSGLQITKKTLESVKPNIDSLSSTFFLKKIKANINVR